MAAINAMIVRHGRAIEVLMQDVRQIRGDMTELRQETAARFDRLESSLAVILAAVAPGHPPPA